MYQPCSSENPQFLQQAFWSITRSLKKRSTGRGEKRPADRKKHGRGHGGFRDWYQEGELDSQACGGLDLSASNRCWGFETTVVRNGDRPKPWEYFVVMDLSYSLGKLVSSRCWGYRAHMILQGIQDIWLEEMPATVDCHLLYVGWLEGMIPTGVLSYFYHTFATGDPNISLWTVFCSSSFKIFQ